MVAAFLIMLREGLEAALITGIIATYLAQTGRASWLPAVWVGVFLAIALSLFVGAGLQLASASFPQKIQELFEAGVGAIAVVVLVWMVFWMRKAARSIKAELHDSIDAALSSDSGQSLGADRPWSSSRLRAKDSSRSSSCSPSSSRAAGRKCRPRRLPAFWSARRDRLRHLCRRGAAEPPPASSGGPASSS